ncbi:hypothetical protein ABZP36_009305 [Zizania latifolia]
MGRSPCCEKAHTNKGAWTKEEDQRLIAYIKANGEGCWRSLPKAAAASTGHHHPHDHFAVPSNSPEACSHSSDDEPSSATPPPPPPPLRHLGIDLNLSISLAPYQPSQEDQPGEPLKQEETASGEAGNATAVCLCLNRLGLHGSERCSCGRGGAPSMQASTHMFRFITPLDNSTSTTMT